MTLSRRDLMKAALVVGFVRTLTPRVFAAPLRESRTATVRLLSVEGDVLAEGSFPWDGAPDMGSINPIQLRVVNGGLTRFLEIVTPEWTHVESLVPTKVETEHKKTFSGEGWILPEADEDEGYGADDPVHLTFEDLRDEV